MPVSSNFRYEFTNRVSVSSLNLIFDLRFTKVGEGIILPGPTLVGVGEAATHARTNILEVKTLSK